MAIRRGGIKMSEVQIWQGTNGIDIPANIRDANVIVKYASNLTVKQQTQIINAFAAEAYDMASEYAWKKAMVKLKETLATLGMDFIGEMIGRDDLDDSSSVDTVITDFTAIQLAEQLGVISRTAALKLRQSNELILHFFSKDANEELGYLEAFGIIRSSVQYILGEADISVAIEFSQFRERLQTESIAEDDPQIEQLSGSAIFYLRTTLTIIISSIKSEAGARLEHALANLNTLIGKIWGKIAESDKWSIGAAYRDAVASGNVAATSGIRNALMKVGGFDYVPENLRSSSFIKAAKHLVDVHFSMNNFYNEPSAIKKLSSLGTVIPAPAFAECMQAYLCVLMGNKYGTSTIAAEIANSELKKISKDRWHYYFEKIIHTDKIILGQFQSADQVSRLHKFLLENGLDTISGLPRENQTLHRLVCKNDYIGAAKSAQILAAKL